MTVTLSVGEFGFLMFFFGANIGVLLSFGIPWLVRIFGDMELGER